MVKVALTYIIKDDSQKEQFEKSLKSFTPYFDKVYVAVTGPSGKHDEIHKLVKKYNGYSISTSPETHPQIYHQWEEGKWEFARFHEARKVAFDMVPADKYDYISWADYDDILIGGEDIKPVLERAKNDDVGMLYCTYWYSNMFDEQGNVLKTAIMHERERFIKPGTTDWKSHLHEVLIPKVQIKLSRFSRDPQQGINLVWVHTASGENSLDSLKRNIKILELQAKEEDYKDPRTLFYLAKTYYDMGPDYYNLVEKFISMYIPISGWEEEIGNAYEYLGMVKAKQGDLENAVKFYKESIKLFPENHTSYLKLIDILFNTNQIDRAKHYLKVYETLGEVKSQATIGSPVEVEMLYCGVKWLEAQKAGKIDECLKWAERRSKTINDNLLGETVLMAETERIAQAFLNLCTFYIKNEMFEQVLYLLEHMPKSFEHEAFIKNIVNKLPGKKHDDKSIVYFATFYNPHFETWNGNSLKTGIGGSESAVIYLSQEWVKMGYDVTVYCDTDEDIEINGVKYVKYWKVNFNDEFNIFISWRTPAFSTSIKTRKHFLDLHDKIVVPEEYTEQIMSKIDKVFFKSKDHATQIPQLPIEKRVVISNGIVL